MRGVPIAWREVEAVDAERAFRCIKASELDGDGARGLSIEADIK